MKAPVWVVKRKDGWRLSLRESLGFCWLPGPELAVRFGRKRQAKEAARIFGRAHGGPCRVVRLVPRKRGGR